MPRLPVDLGSAVVINQIAYVRVGVVDQAPDGTWPTAPASVNGIDYANPNRDMVRIGGITYSKVDANGVTVYTPGMRAISLLASNAGRASQPTPGATVTVYAATVAGVIRLRLNDSLVNTTLYLNGDPNGTSHPPGNYFDYQEGSSLPVSLSPGDVISFSTGGTYTMYYTFLPSSY